MITYYSECIIGSDSIFEPLIFGVCCPNIEERYDVPELYIRLELNIKTTPPFIFIIVTTKMLHFLLILYPPQNNYELLKQTLLSYHQS